MRSVLSGISAKLRAFLCIAASAAVMLSTCSFSALAEENSQEVKSETEMSVDPTGRGDGYSAVLYDNTKGLPTSEANAIAQTEEGFIWIGSYSGLIRYDGNSFERYDSTTGLSSVVSLFVDSKNRLWVGTNDSGAAVMENGEIRMYNKNDGMKSLSVRSIIEDTNGDIYIATTHGLVVVDDTMEMRQVDAPQINDEFIRMLKLGTNGVIYGITMDGALFTMKDGKLTSFHNAKNLGINDVHSVFPDPDNPGYVYLANKESGLYYGELSDSFRNTETMSVAPLYYVNSIEGINGMLWVCADNGIGFVNNGSFVKIENIPMNTSVEEMMVDYQGNLWFVSSQQGVMKIVPNQFIDLFDKYEFDDEVVYSTCYSGGRLFIGTKNSGLRVIDENGEIRESALAMVQNELRTHFRPEFLNRLDETILFKPLTRENVGGIIDLLMKDVNARLEEKQLTVELSEEAKQLIAQEAYDPVYGARPLKRYLQKNVETLAARKILEGDVEIGDVIRIETDGDGLRAIVEKKQ